MARRAKPSASNDLISRISDTISTHSRLSAAAAFQMGVLLGQVMHNTGALDGLKRSVAAAPGAIASSIPTFGLFDSKPQKKRKVSRSVAKRQSTKKAAPAKRRKPAARA